jgi:PGF-CTERM protein
MTKRLTIALVAVALFVLMAVMPVSAIANGTVINQGATVFIGEEGLNITHAINQAQSTTVTDGVPTFATIAWWASAADVSFTVPSKTIDVSTRLSNFMVAPADFVGYAGNWYLVGANGRTIITTGVGNNGLVFTVADPTLDIKIWDFVQSADVTGKSVPQGQKLGFRIDTNMYPAVSQPALRNNVIDSFTYGPGMDDGWVNDSVYAVRTNYSYMGKLTWAGVGYGYQTVTPTVSTYFVANNTLVSTSTIPTLTNENLFKTSAASGDGFIDLVIKDESNAQINALLNASSTAGPAVAGPHSVLKNFVNNQPFFWGSTAANGFVWQTDALDVNNQYAYPVGTYSVYAKSLLNKMKDNYKSGGADYTGKTVSQTYTVTLVSDTVKIEANKDSVVRSKSFSVTITGKPSTAYYVWVKGISSLSGGYDDQPPMLVQSQASVAVDNPLGPYTIGSYQYENGAGTTIQGDVANDAYTWNGTRCYAQVTTDTAGVRTVEFLTTNWTKAQKYTIRVENNPSRDVYKSDEVDVNVEKGAVTIVAAGDQSYYLGEEIKLSGTNTETYKTYLFIVGPNLKTQGSRIQNADPRNFAVVNGDPSTFKAVDVAGDNTWSWKWGTSNYALDAGTYTIYAVSQPNDKDNLQNAAYGTVSIIIKKPFVSATASQSTVAKGDRIFITGTAEGQPSSVQIWIMGKNFFTLKSASVNADASFSYEVRQEVTKSLSSGQYFVVVQHPMQNNKFDVNAIASTVPGSTDVWVYNLQLQNTQTVGAPTVQNATKIFKLGGAGSLQGSDAAEALAEGINDANVDDTYTKLQFLIEEPVIRIDPIGDKHVGDKFTITAQTNLAVDDEVLVQVYSSSFKPTQKSQSGEFSGATGTIKVTKGDSGLNKLSFDVDSSTFKPDEYIVTENAVIQDDATGTALFNVLEGAAPTVATTAVPTTAVVTAVPTTVVPTTAPTAAPTTKSPGYGALIALIGLGAVAFIVVRRH